MVATACSRDQRLSPDSRSVTVPGWTFSKRIPGKLTRVSYSAVTSYLGFEPSQDEYKVMGLASFGYRALSLVIYCGPRPMGMRSICPAASARRILRSEKMNLFTVRASTRLACS